MSEMVERVAVALWRADEIRTRGLPAQDRWTDIEGIDRDGYRQNARAAIQAMQEATEPMTAATANDMPAWKAEATFRTMIRAALAD